MPYKCNENATPFATTPPIRSSRPNRNRICVKRGLEAQQRSGEKKKKVNSEIQKRPYSQICVINTISSKMFILMFTHDCLGWFINCHHVVIYYYFEMNRQIIHFLLLQKFFINSISCRLYGLRFCFEHTEPILYVFCIF